jgi:adenosine deaminase
MPLQLFNKFSSLQLSDLAFCGVLQHPGDEDWNKMTTLAKTRNLLGIELTDLHIHLGGAVAPHILWSLAHQQGFKLPVNNYWEFVDFITIDPSKIQSLDDYLKYFHWTEKIQSSPEAVERSVYEIISKELRSSNVTQLELRFNPMKRNRGGEQDLDHIIHAALRGLDRVILDYQVKAGLIFCLAREFPYELNNIIMEKAAHYQHRGVIGIDLAGSESQGSDLSERSGEYADLFARARDHGLGITVHVGETTDSSADDVMELVEIAKPHRIGHGIQAAFSDEALRMLRERNICMEICPTSNLQTHAVDNLEQLKWVFQRLQDASVPFTVNTDNPYLSHTNLRFEIELLLNNELIEYDKLVRCFESARRFSFIS